MKKCKPIQPENQSSATIVAVADSPLSTTEATVLADCERVIERGQRVFLDTANALATIRDGRLYRATHDTFEAYCKHRWKIGRNYANKQIAAAKVVKTLGTTVPILPTAETQVRPLLEFDEADQPKVWEKVVRQIASDGGDSQAITARQITDAIEHEISKSEDGPFQKVKAQREAKAQANRARYVQTKVEKSKAKKKREAEEAATKAKLKATIDALPPDKNNAVAYIREILADGGLHPRDRVSGHAAFWTRDKLTAVYVNELQSPTERSKRLEQIVSWDSQDYRGHGIIDTTLAAMVWLGLVSMDGDGEHTAYRLVESGASDAEPLDGQDGGPEE
jgi:hypothetical protein